MAEVTDISSSEFYSDKSKKDILDCIHDEIVAIRNTLTSVLVGSGTWDVGSLADGAGESKDDFTVTGAALGDFVLCSFSVSIAGLNVTPYVVSANTVGVRVQNESGAGPVDLASATVRFFVIKAAAVALVAKVLTK